MKDADRSQVVNDLKWELYGIENEEMITEMERRAKEKIARGPHKAPRKKKKK